MLAQPTYPTGSSAELQAELLLCPQNNSFVSAQQFCSCCSLHSGLSLSLFFASSHSTHPLRRSSKATMSDSTVSAPILLLHLPHFQLQAPLFLFPGTSLACLLRLSHFLSLEFLTGIAFLHMACIQGRSLQLPRWPRYSALQMTSVLLCEILSRKIKIRDLICKMSLWFTLNSSRKEFWLSFFFFFAYPPQQCAGP